MAEVRGYEWDYGCQPDGEPFTDKDGNEVVGADCYSCGEPGADHPCPNSKRPCGHHCNCSWVHDRCHWCGKEFGEEAGER